MYFKGHLFKCLIVIKSVTLSIKIICIHKKCFSNTNSFIELPFYIKQYCVSAVFFFKD